MTTPERTTHCADDAAEEPSGAATLTVKESGAKKNWRRKTGRRREQSAALRVRAHSRGHPPGCWNTADTTQRVVLLMTEVTCMRDVVLVREAGGAGGIFGIAALGCVLHACYLHRIHNIPYSGYFLLFLKFTALYTLYSSLGFPPLYILPHSAEHTPPSLHAITGAECRNSLPQCMR